MAKKSEPLTGKETPEKGSAGEAPAKKAPVKGTPKQAATTKAPAKEPPKKAPVKQEPAREAPGPAPSTMESDQEELRLPGSRGMPRTGANREDDLQKRLTPEEVEEFRQLLSERRRSLIESARETMAAQEALEARAPDEVDQASTEYDQSFEYRMRDREKFLLRKIEKALLRIEEGEYDVCESCGNPIGRKRLLARPETTFCIVCKEEQERQEKMFQKRRQQRATLDF